MLPATFVVFFTSGSLGGPGGAVEFVSPLPPAAFAAPPSPSSFANFYFYCF